MTYTRKKVTKAFFKKLQEQFSNEEMVELTAVIALENFRSKFNPVFGIESNGFCVVPKVVEAASKATDAFG